MPTTLTQNASQGDALPPDIDRLEMRLLAKLLRPCLGVAQSRRTAYRLLETFGSVGAALSADTRRLQRIEGIGPASAAHMAHVFSAAQFVAKEQIFDQRSILSSWSELIEYMRLQIVFSPVEHFHALFLDRKNRLIADERLHTGTVDKVMVYPREIIRRAIELSATALVLVHNHPSGDPAPSAGDVRMTKEISDIAKSMGIVLHDHIIIGKSGHASLRKLGLLT